MAKNIMLIGFMGTGKTTVSKQLSEVTGRNEVDIDAYLVEKEGTPISEIFEKFGEDHFRDIETKYLIEIQQNSDLIVSCGGGIVVREENVKHMKENGIIVWLTATPETIYERVKDSTDRPILNGNMNIEYIASLMEKRKNLYLSVADVIVSTDGKSINEICNEIIEKSS